MPGQKPLRSTVFISYCHDDQQWLERLQIHLRPLERGGIVDRWDDTRIATGQKWKAEIQKALDHAKVAVLLISADYLASDFIANNELPPLLAAAANEGLVVLPVVLSPSRFTRTPVLSQFQAANDPARPLVVLTRGEQEDVWVKLCDDVEAVLSRPVPATVDPTAPEAQRDGRGLGFVIQALGKKTDYQSGRTLDMDRSYDVIKEAIQGAGLKCVRLDEVAQPTAMEAAMFEYVLTASVVIVDLSTSNANALYGLGVCHALRPHGTIVVAESGFRPPFDLSHFVIQAYEHLGPDIGRSEAVRLKNTLTQAIEARLADTAERDSPLYLHLPNLIPPARG